MGTEYGKKVFFLYPPSVVKDEMVKDLIDDEYEVYLLQNHHQAAKLFREYRDSVVFINIDYNLRGGETWEDYIKALMENEVTKDLKIGVVSYESDKELIEKYLMEMMVPCGFVRLSQGFKESLSIIKKALDANEAKRRRKYVRVKCKDPMKATFIITKDGKTYTGKVMDISSFGMSISFDEAKTTLFENKEYLQNIQLRLNGVLCRASGFVIGRVDGIRVANIVIFSKETSQSSREKIHNFVHHCLQYEIDQKLKVLG
jgi:hypothetical protein